MRSLAAAVVLALLPWGVPSSGAVSPVSGGDVASRVQGISISLEATPTWVRKGRTVTLSGRVRGARGRSRVVIFQKNKGAKRWVVEATKRTTRKGRFTHREDVKTGDRTYRACVKRRCDKVVVHMGRPPARPTTVGISSLSATSVEAGQAFLASGSASSNLNGRTVQVQAYNAAAGSWGQVGSAVVQDGQWTASASISSAGRSIPLRAAFAGTKRLKSSRSSAQNVTVFGWYYLADRESVDSVRFDTGSATMSGVPYSHSLFNSTDFWWESQPWGEWNLSYACRTFDAAIGLDDESETNFRVGFRSWADSIERFHGIQTTGQAPARVTFDVTGVFRLRLQDEYVAGSSGSGNGHGWGVWGNARVLCAF